jgi:peptide deformylase
MAILDILHFPDMRLRIHAEPVQQVNEAVRKIVDDMFETMYAAPGVGLAATQVNIHKQIIVIDLSDSGDSPLCLINPNLLKSEGITSKEEGCLSVPDVFESVKRANSIIVQALDYQGKTINIEANDFLAVCIQHEMDHLKGKLFIDYLSSFKRQRIRKKLEKQQRLK